jgi:hypothetical protein
MTFMALLLEQKNTQQVNMQLSPAERSLLLEITTKSACDALLEMGWESTPMSAIMTSFAKIKSYRDEINSRWHGFRKGKVAVCVAESNDFQVAIAPEDLRLIALMEGLSTFEAIALLSSGKLPWAREPLSSDRGVWMDKEIHARNGYIQYLRDECIRPGTTVMEFTDWRKENGDLL